MKSSLIYYYYYVLFYFVRYFVRPLFLNTSSCSNCCSKQWNIYHHHHIYFYSFSLSLLLMYIIYSKDALIYSFVAVRTFQPQLQTLLLNDCAIVISPHFAYSRICKEYYTTCSAMCLNNIAFLEILLLCKCTSMFCIALWSLCISSACIPCILLSNASDQKHRVLLPWHRLTLGYV